MDWPDSDTDRALQQWWQAWPQPGPTVLGIAYSGGADSTALLLAAVRLLLRQRDELPALRWPTRLVVLHVHHGLQQAADGFEHHGQVFCAALQAAHPILQQDLHWCSRHIQVDHQPGASLEASARQARYGTLAEMAREQGASLVLLGQHADDQAESLLLALSRGAGVAGLAAMAARFKRHGMLFARPLLDVPAAELRRWLQAWQVPWIDDPTNVDQRFTRNRFRHTLLPVLEQAMPAFRSSFARSARLAAEADQLLQELAAIDLQQAGQPPRIRTLQALSLARQANALRHWLKQAHGVIGSEAQLHALLEVLAACTTRGHQIRIRVGPGYVVRQGELLGWVEQA
ncbi:MAG: tRNA lysidine(34) synthetase TilS [Ramlibacter sp.]|nr:tRNA lysidine(34) synthetase TilS [Ramlibacter sp.]